MPKQRECILDFGLCEEKMSCFDKALTSIDTLVLVPEKSQTKFQRKCYPIFPCGKVSHYLSEMSGINRIYRMVIDKTHFSFPFVNLTNKTVPKLKFYFVAIIFFTTKLLFDCHWGPNVLPRPRISSSRKVLLDK
jgi:hypothetical protein